MDIADLIDKAYDAQPDQPARRYIGASIIGAKCDAELAFSLRGFPNTKIDAQLLRIFHAGHRIEDWVVADLKRAGIHVMDVDPLTGKQWEYRDWGGHISMHTDGLVESDVPMLLEIKSMNNDKWNECSKKGVKYSHRNYYDQVQFMMGYAHLEKCLFVAYNKNNSKYHSEIVEFDEFYFLGIKERAERVLRGEAMKCATDQSDWRCKGCFKRTVCWDKPNLEWKQWFCQHANPTKSGAWECGIGNAECTSACSDYEVYKPKEKT